MKVLTQRRNPGVTRSPGPGEAGQEGLWPVGQHTAPPPEGQPQFPLPPFPTWEFGPAFVNPDISKGSKKSGRLCEISGLLTLANH